jgi:DNA helicase II / ATP-dependent DNA helicase PcrA
MREFEDRFVTLGLNYRVVGGPRFYERLEIRDALAYFRVVAQGADDLAFERIVNVPKRGLGEATIRQIHDTARARGIPMLQAAGELAESDELKPKPRAALREVAANFARWQGQLDRTSHVQLAETILEESGYTDMWKNDRSAEAPGRLENLKELIRSMEEFESLRSFLEHVALVMDAEQNEEMDAVTLMTLHSAKGLEFDTIFLPGWEEGLFPHQRALDEGGRAGLEEERRLAYVGLTRAKKNLHVWFSSNRRIHGLWQSTVPSRFLDELPEAHVEVAETGSSYGGYGIGYGGGGGFGEAGRRNPYGASRFDDADPFANSYQTPGWQRAQQHRSEATARNWGTRSGHAVERIGYGEVDSGYGAGRGSVKGRTIEGELVAKSVSSDPSPFKVGDRVFHQKFGNGNVAAIDGNKLTIDFDKAGQKRVLDSFVTGV